MKIKRIINKIGCQLFHSCRVPVSSVLDCITAIIASTFYILFAGYLYTTAQDINQTAWTVMVWGIVWLLILLLGVVIFAILSVVYEEYIAYSLAWYLNISESTVNMIVHRGINLSILVLWLTIISTLLMPHIQSPMLVYIVSVAICLLGLIVSKTIDWAYNKFISKRYGEISNNTVFECNKKM